MEAFDGWDYPSGSTDNTKFIVIKQDLETKLNVSITYCVSKIVLRNSLDLNKTDYDFLMSNQYIDINGYRYCIMQLPYFMISN